MPGGGRDQGGLLPPLSFEDDLAVAAADYWSETTGALFEKAAYHDPEDPLDRVLGYLDFRKALVQGDVPEFTCLVGTMVQEVYDTNPSIRDACNRSITGHAATLVSDIAEAAEARGVEVPGGAESLALHTQVVIQGAFVLAKAGNAPSIATDSIDHLKRYVELLFGRSRNGRAQ